MNSSPQNTNTTGTGQRRTAGVDNSDEEEWSGVVECAVLERTKSDRVTRADEDRRRRTIIVEKKNGTYGFTLQEIEMVTYVDYVEYDGPAFKAGMREGDVILSINGHEMDRADHKTLVNFIKNCDTRMRMVVSFEDCVRKVELHMRYIELQRALQSRLNELERLCERERSILMGRWKTHSLPARKRTPNTIGTNPNQPSPSSSFNSSTIQCCRPATSTEHLLLYNFADGRSCLIPRSAACLVTVGPPRSRSDHHHFLSKMSSESAVTSLRHSYHQSNGMMGTPAKSKSHKQSCQQQQQQSSTAGEGQSLHSTPQNNLCVACISSANRRREQSDSVSLDAYDLASPCCDPNCVPSRRRREKQRRARNEQALHQQQQQQQQQQQVNMQHHHIQGQRDQQSQQQSQPNTHSCSRTSGHSLHSITSSDVSTADSVASCSTSLSTDTLYWDPSVHQRPPPCLQYAKPKSWDNLTTKAFGGYGFGYGYLDTVTIKTHSAERPGKGSHSSGTGRSKTPIGTVQRKSSGASGSTAYSTTTSSTVSRHFQPTKSTESLLIPPGPYQGDLDQASLSCECLDGGGGGPGSRFIQLDKHKRADEAGYVPPTHAQVRHRRSSHSDGKLRAINNSEVTRL
ncbi:General receptor for phosphoinositides 1-associated scaffold protein [Atta colombica]|uniref:General receptor for phosphoinositides 1-associated scaffold protein n=1 Tax=Atta colombica TaxID=520822 RepID=A0A195BVG5_9HYME|nr:General receptor for phosphoinositides 1-associated scaffold protein [Atta colombica]